ncbi:MAG: head GIN domain-containing protein [Methanosarcinaceae archaeon]
MSGNEMGLKKMFEKKGKEGLEKKGNVRREEITIKKSGKKPSGISFLLPGILILILAAVMAGSGCAAYECEPGSGNVEEENRNVEPYHSVDSQVSGDIFVKQDGGSSLVIEAEDNLLPLLETSVENGVLVIRAKKCIRPLKPIKVYAGMEEVRSLSLSGSGDITGTTPIDSENLELAIIGSGDIEMEVNASSLKSQVSGSGDFLLEGDAATHEIEIDGSGDVDALGLRTEVTRVRIYGSGDAKVYTDREMDVEIAGSGSVYYWGEPEKFNTQVSGSGKIEKIDDRE